MPGMDALKELFPGSEETALNTTLQKCDGDIPKAGDMLCPGVLLNDKVPERVTDLTGNQSRRASWALFTVSCASNW